MSSRGSNGRSADRTSASLLQGVRRHEAAAWQRLVDIYSPMIYYWCQKTGLPAQEIPDVFQDVFHAIARNLQTYQPTQGGSFRGWLRTITRNKINDHYRRLGRQPQPLGGSAAKLKFQSIAADNPGENQNPVGDSEEAVICGALKTALANIKPHFQPQTWSAFWQVVVEGRETGEVAAELAVRPGTVRVAKSRVLKRLRCELGESVEE